MSTLKKTIQKTISKVVTQEVEINLPFYGKDKDGLFICIISEKESFEIYLNYKESQPNGYRYHDHQKRIHSSVPGLDKLETFTEITKEEFFQAYSSYLGYVNQFFYEVLEITNQSIAPVTSEEVLNMLKKNFE